MPDTADHYAPNPDFVRPVMTDKEIEKVQRARSQFMSDAAVQVALDRKEKGGHQSSETAVRVASNRKATPKKPSNSKAAQIARAMQVLRTAGYSVTMPVPPVHKPVVAYKLAGLKADRWAYVARKVPQGEYDVWAWSLSVAERNRLNQQANEGAIITSQRKGVDGVVRLMARLKAKP